MQLTQNSLTVPQESSGLAIEDVVGPITEVLAGGYVGYKVDKYVYDSTTKTRRQPVSLLVA